MEESSNRPMKNSFVKNESQLNENSGSTLVTEDLRQLDTRSYDVIILPKTAIDKES
jgi:hypothetical protein